MSAALSQYLNVVEDLRAQLPEQGSTAGGRDSPGESDVDDWASPRSVVANVEHPGDASQERSTGADPEEDRYEAVETAIEELADRVATLESDLASLAATVSAIEEGDMD